MEMQFLYYTLAVILVLVGIGGVILPALPGLPLVFAGMLLAAWAGDFQQIGWFPLVVLGLMTLLSVAVDFFATMVGAKRVGASRKALIGAMVGTFAGLFFGPIGLFVDLSQARYSANSGTARNWGKRPRSACRRMPPSG